MTRRRLYLSVGASVFGALLAASYRLFWIPSQRLADPEFLENASEGELVRTAEHALSFPGANQHDACILLGEYGGIGSVPALLRGLWFNPPADDGMVCTTLHCLDALEQITGYDAGSTPEAWETWWSTTGSRLPPSAFPLGSDTSSSPPAPRVRRARRAIDEASAGACVHLDHGLESGRTCVRKRDGTVWCWGAETWGRAPNRVSLEPKPVAALGAGVAEVVAGSFRTCARKTDGTLWCWSLPREEEPTPSPAIYPELGDEVVGVALGGSSACVVKDDGTLHCWPYSVDGKVRSGRISHAKRLHVWTPEVTALGTTVVEVTRGERHGCARKEDGSVWCWRDNSNGEIGLGTVTGREPVSPVSELGSRVVELEAGHEHTCARWDDGSVWCWGRNQQGQLGDGTTTSAATPVEVTMLGGDVEQIAVGSTHTCARKRDGTLWCWGWNHDGELGDGTTVQSAVPVYVAALGDRVREVAVGPSHTCARTSDDSIWCWGWNHDGELGDGTRTDRLTPVKALIGCAASE